MTATAPVVSSRRTPGHSHQPVASAPVHKMRRRRLRSQLLGDLIVEEDAILEFPDGLFGFASCKEWVLVSAGRPGWCWLHAVDHAALAFLLVDPFDAVPEFAVALTPQDLAALDAQSATEVGVFAIVTLPRTAADVMTVNLQGPVAIVASSRRGRQLVLGDARASDARFGARAPLSAPFDTLFDTPCNAPLHAPVEAGAQVLRERTDTQS